MSIDELAVPLLWLPCDVLSDETLAVEFSRLDGCEVLVGGVGYAKHAREEQQRNEQDHQRCHIQHLRR